MPIYDPNTQCGAYGNAACVTGAPQRTQFPGNVIPTSRINPVAKNLMAFPLTRLPRMPAIRAATTTTSTATPPPAAITTSGTSAATTS